MKLLAKMLAVAFCASVIAALVASPASAQTHTRMIVRHPLARHPMVVRHHHRWHRGHHHGLVVHHKVVHH